MINKHEIDNLKGEKYEITNERAVYSETNRIV